MFEVGLKIQNINKKEHTADARCFKRKSIYLKLSYNKRFDQDLHRQYIEKSRYQKKNYKNKYQDVTKRNT